MLAQTDAAQSHLHPERLLAAVPSRRGLVAALAAATAASLVAAAVVIPRIDYASAAEFAVSMRPNAAEMTPFAREEAIATAVKVARVGAWSKAIFVPVLRAMGIAFAAWLAFRVAAGRPSLRDALAASAVASLPLALRDLLGIPAALVRGTLPPGAAGDLLPSNLAALLPPGLPPPLARAAGGVDLFALACAALLAAYMATAARVSRRRAVAVVAILFAAGVAVGDVALPALAQRP